MIGLTPRMRELLVYIQTRELCPSFEEMRKALGLGSRSGVFRLLEALEERGFIRRLRNRARAIEVLVDEAPPIAPPPPRRICRSDVIDIPVYGRTRINWLSEKPSLYLSNEDRRALLKKGRG